MDRPEVPQRKQALIKVKQLALWAYELNYKVKLLS